MKLASDATAFYSHLAGINVDQPSPQTTMKDDAALESVPVPNIMEQADTNYYLVRIRKQ